jgi:hypothetical protein
MNDLDLDLIWKAYRLTLKFGDDAKQIAEAMFIDENKLEQLMQWEPFANAAKAAMADRLPACFEDLSEESKNYWTILSDSKSHLDTKQAALLAIARNGERERQRILAYGLMQNFFDVPSACKALGVPLKQFRKWVETDSEFAEMIAEVQASKRFFVEGQLFKLVALGSERATLFAAERLMPKEYGAKVHHSGTIEHQHNHNHNQFLNLENLPVAIRGKIFDLLMESNLIDPDGLLVSSPTIDATAVKKLT